MPSNSHLNAAWQAYRARQFEQVASLCHEALTQDASSGETHDLLGLCRLAQGDLQAAIAELHTAVELDANSATFHCHLAMALQAAGQNPSAIEHYERALRLNRNHVEALTGLAMAYTASGKLDWAEDCARRALAIRPDDPAAWFRLGEALLRQGRIDEACRAFEASARAAPGNPIAHLQAGKCLFWQNRLAEAVARYDEAIRLQPDLAVAHEFCGMALLAGGDFARGLHEWQWRAKNRRSAGAVPDWEGGDVRGQKVLVYSDDLGLGDVMQYVRYVREIERRGAEAWLEVPEALTPLLRKSGFEKLVAQGSPINHVDCQVALLSLPWIFSTRIDSIPAQVPYLTADPALVDIWRRRLATAPGFKVAIHWGGSPLADAEQRSIPVSEFASVARVPGVTLISVQKQNDVDGSAACRALGILEFAGELDAAHGRFMDTAAIMWNVDLVITSDTATAHLAGALGVPVWVALMHVCDWRWMRDRDDSPWYPTARLFRQPQRGDWPRVFQAMAQEFPSVVGRRVDRPDGSRGSSRL